MRCRHQSDNHYVSLSLSLPPLSFCRQSTPRHPKPERCHTLRLHLEDQKSHPTVSSPLPSLFHLLAPAGKLGSADLLADVPGALLPQDPTRNPEGVVIVGSGWILDSGMKAFYQHDTLTLGPLYESKSRLLRFSRAVAIYIPI